MQVAVINIWSRRGALLLALTALVGAALGCGGGGGGGGGGNPGTPVTVRGVVLRAETNLAPNPVATVTIGGVSRQTEADGSFSLPNVPSNTTTATITAQGSQTRTLTVALTANQINELGTIFISDTGYTAIATGTVRTQDTNQAVGNALVTIAGSQDRTDTNGNFRIENLPIGLGNIPNTSIGTVEAAGFETKQIIPQFVFVAGDNPLGNVLIAQPVGSTPPPPFTITGRVLTQGQPTSATVTISSGGNNLGSIGTNAQGQYFFWVVPGTYRLTARNGAGATQFVDVTLQSVGVPVTAPNITF